MALLFLLPLEVFESILVLMSAEDVARVSECCKRLHAIIHNPNDQHIWRTLFLRDFDDPRRPNSGRPSQDICFDWAAALRRRIWAQNWVRFAQKPRTTAVPSEDTAPFSKLDGEILVNVQEAYRRCASVLVTAEASQTLSDHGIATSKNIRWIHHLLGESAIHMWPWLLSPDEFDQPLTPPNAPSTSLNIGKRPPGDAGRIDDGDYVPPSDIDDGDVSDLESDDGEDDESTSSIFHGFRSSSYGIPMSSFTTHCHKRWRLVELAGFDYSANALNHSWAETSSITSLSPGKQVSQTRIAARKYVYDLRNYGRQTLWGPWKLVEDDTGKRVLRVNWKHVCSILGVLVFNLVEYQDAGQFQRLTPPLSYLSTIPYSAACPYKLHPRDWAGVEGMWKRVVSFMDYRDLIAFNTLSADPTNPQGELSDAILRMAEFGEAVRVLMLRLRIESIDSPHARESIDPTRPKIRFRGESQGGVPSEATVHGSVEVTDAGDIRWRLRLRAGSSIQKASALLPMSSFIPLVTVVDSVSDTDMNIDIREKITNFSGQDRWQSSGVQIGGPFSAFGVLGCWSPFEADAVPSHGRVPAGPFWMFKAEPWSYV